MLNRLRSRVKGERDQRQPDGNSWIIIGLGNPGRRYEGTRHNAGFMVVDRLYDRLPGGAVRNRFQANFVETRDGEKRVVLVKPETFMNDSGVAVAQLQRWYKSPLEQILVIYDDLDLPLGTIRLRPGGSAGGHNGLESVIHHLHTTEFSRLRIGISRPRSGSTVPYVLSRFTSDERRVLPAVIDRAANAALYWLHHGIHAAMNEYNRRESAESTRPARGGDGSR